MLSARVLLLIAIGLSLVGCDPSLSVDVRRGAITGGESYSGHIAVGKLLSNQGALCTATLVGKRTVLTAAHCIVGTSFSFYLDDGKSFSVTAAHKHPSWTGDGSPNDIAVVRLASAPPISSIPIATAAPAQGMAITLVGYGATMCQVNSYGMLDCSNDSGIKRRGTNKIAQLGATEFTFVGTGSTCKGDSGGPAFAMIGGRELQIGVTSRGAMPCGTQAVDTRVDAYSAWISQVSDGDINTGEEDTAAPAVEITSPAAGAELPAGTTAVKIEVSDDSGVREVRLLVDGVVAAKATLAPYDFQVSLEAGSRALKVEAEDEAGNVGVATVTVNVVAGSSTDPGLPPAVAPGAFGSSCEVAADCDSGLCADDPVAQQKYCTALCDAGTSCPSEKAICTPTADPQLQVCALDGTPSSGASLGANELVGSCSVGRAPVAPPASLLLLLALLLLRRRSP